MHQYDPNGAIKAYRAERDKKENTKTLLFCAAVGMGLVILYALFSVTLSIIDGWQS